MSSGFLAAAAEAVLLFHLAVVLFNVAGLVVIPLGAWRGWTFVRRFWWRAIHVAILAVVALQAVLQRVCFPTLWQARLLQQAGESASTAPLIQRLVARAVFWPLPLWFFAGLYMAVCLYTVLLWWLVPPRLPGRRSMS